MAKKKNKTFYGVIGVILTLFGMIGAIRVALNREYILGLPLTGLLVIIGVILMPWAIID